MEALEKKDETAKTDAAVEAEPVATPLDTQPAAKGKEEPNEAFFGSVLLFCLALSVIAATGYFGLAGYRYFRQVQAEKAIPSIESLPKSESPVVAKDDGKDDPGEVVKETPAATEKPVDVDKKTLAIKVLNGGSAKGVAGTYAEKLKTAGFTKTTFGNSLADYTGQTLYYAASETAGAVAIKAEVMKTYPTVTVKEAPAGNKDATVATFVLILGR